MFWWSLFISAGRCQVKGCGSPGFYPPPYALWFWGQPDFAWGSQMLTGQFPPKNGRLMPLRKFLANNKLFDLFSELINIHSLY